MRPGGPQRHKLHDARQLSGVSNRPSEVDVRAYVDGVVSRERTMRCNGSRR